jgi:hypothetical protein
MAKDGAFNFFRRVVDPSIEQAGKKGKDKNGWMRTPKNMA